MVISPALQRGEKGFHKFVPEPRRGGANGELSSRSCSSDCPLRGSLTSLLQNSFADNFPSRAEDRTSRKPEAQMTTRAISVPSPSSLVPVFSFSSPQNPLENQKNAVEIFSRPIHCS